MLLLRLLAVATGIAVLWITAAVVLSRLLEWLVAGSTPDRAVHVAVVAFAVTATVTLSVLAGVSRASLVWVFIGDRAADEALPQLQLPYPQATQVGTMRVATALLLCVAISAAALVETVRANNAISPERAVEITAHRAGSARAPENTVEALETAISEGADVVEVDVQETADGNVVVLHDTDLRRVAGVARSIWDMRLDELRALDVGSWFSPAFHAARIPTLAEFAIAARGRVRLNVELKNNRRGEDLAARAVAVLGGTGTINQAVVSSLDLGLLKEVRDIAPQISEGLILATGIGNLRRVDVDFLALSRRLATPAVISQLHGIGRQVHVWTLDDKSSIARAMLDGADNIITSDTKMAVEVRAWFERISEPERTLLRMGRFAQRIDPATDTTSP